MFFKTFINKLRLMKNILFTPAKLDPPKEVIVIGSTGSGRARRFLTKPLKDIYRERQEELNKICEKFSQDLSDTIETEW